jgi:hypothetical protein
MVTMKQLAIQISFVFPVTLLAIKLMILQQDSVYVWLDIIMILSIIEAVNLVQSFQVVLSA